MCVTIYVTLECDPVQLINMYFVSGPKHLLVPQINQTLPVPSGSYQSSTSGAHLSTEGTLGHKPCEASSDTLVL